ncbi:hypothetical protein HH214_18815 [Mucilaginibacter robiniae]|uniref:Transposase DDE domain-containing protein n=1 Tax=Mucilaginibacter robiniae TaxID=2728022 RepID=A0A7L5E636_9SPHI|nr:hypothetical protein [Mucilaginibacter robiniae]QJD97779.1 hypothetical protein HH214_18815 [Mucilaginibacter robiniae]
MNKPLLFKGFDKTADGRLLKNYWAAPKDGKAGAHKVMLMAAIAYNLKNYLKRGG